MAETQPSDGKMWINREEYDRLKKLETDQNFFGEVPAARILTQEVVQDGAAGVLPKLSTSPFSKLQVIVGLIIALLAFVYPPALFLMAVFGAMSIYDYMQARHGARRQHNKTYLAILLLPLLLVAMPTLFLVFFVALYFIQCSLNPCGSS